MDGVPFSEADVTGNVTISPTTLTDGVTSVTITYTDGQGNTVTTTQAVSVTHKLKSIAVTTKPTTTEYEYGDTLSTSGMVVTATYSDGKTATVTPTSTSPTSLTTVGTQTITVSYKDSSVSSAVTTTFTVTVERKSVTKPTWKGTLTYSGSSQSANNTSLWNNYNKSYMTMSGTTSGTNAGTYYATFTPGSNYRWADESTDAISVSWTIAKATYTISLSATTATLTASNYSSGVEITVTRSNSKATGAISASSTNSTGCPVSTSNATSSSATVTIKGNGSTTGPFTVTISAAADTNFYAPSSKTVTVSTSYWEWGSETATGDATWWAGLKSWVASASTTELSNCVGKTKSVTLTSSVLGTTTHLVRCIGYNCDGSQTLTFQTKNCLANTTSFGSSAVWIGSTARSLCTSYYNAFAGKDSIKTVSKGTCASQVSSKNGTATYNSETVFIPSEAEMGLDSYSSLTKSNSTTSNGEFCKGYTTSYQYYSSNSTRIKYQGDSSSSTAWYWERSRRYNGSSRVCNVRSDGSADYNGCYDSGYLAPAFVIG